MGNANEMSFLGHLEELRWHLIRSTLAILIFASLAFIAKDFIFDTLIFGPKKIDFPYLSMVLLHLASLWSGRQFLHNRNAF